MYVSVGVTPRITTPPPTRVGTASVTKHEVSPGRLCPWSIYLRDIVEVGRWVDVYTPFVV